MLADVKSSNGHGRVPSLSGRFVVWEMGREAHSCNSLGCTELFIIISNICNCIAFLSFHK